MSTIGPAATDASGARVAGRPWPGGLQMVPCWASGLVRLGVSTVRMRLSLTPAVLVIGLAAVAHGAIFARLAEADPVVISAVRTGVAGLIMLPLGLATGWTAIRAGGATVLARAGLAGLFLALHFAAWI